LPSVAVMAYNLYNIKGLRNNERAPASIEHDEAAYGIDTAPEELRQR